MELRPRLRDQLFDGPDCIRRPHEEGELAVRLTSRYDLYLELGGSRPSSHHNTIIALALTLTLHVAVATLLHIQTSLGTWQLRCGRSVPGDGSETVVTERAKTVAPLGELDRQSFNCIDERWRDISDGFWRELGGIVGLECGDCV